MVSTGICICFGKKVQLLLVGGCRVWNKFAFVLLRMFETATGKITHLQVHDKHIVYHTETLKFTIFLYEPM